jgi:hypothetical protein
MVRKAGSEKGVRGDARERGRGHSTSCDELPGTKGTCREVARRDRNVRIFGGTLWIITSGTNDANAC